MDGGVIGKAAGRFAHVCASVLLHAGLVALLLLSGGQAQPEKVYRVSLSAFPAVSGALGASGASPKDASAPEASAPSAPEEAPAPSAPEAPIREAQTPEPPAREAPDPETSAPETPDPVPALQVLADKSAAEKREKRKTKNREKAAAKPEAAVPAAGGEGDGPPAEGSGGAGDGPPSQYIGGFAAYDADAVDRRPVVSRRVLPVYPERARRQQVRGRVEVRLIVDASGNPRDCAIHRAEPAGYFEEAALEAARKTRFIPGEIRGRAVNTVVLIPFVFSIR